MAFSSGVALSLPIKGVDVSDGSLVSSSQAGFVLSEIEYDTAFYGVVTTSPSMVFESAEAISDGYPVVISGNVQVRVSAKNGNIGAGDNITTSVTPGVGERADYDGYVVGTANESCESVEKECLISVTLAPRFAQGMKSAMKATNLLQNVKRAVSSPFLSPLTSMRYLLAVTTTAVTFFLAFYFFGRSGKTGIEALGRNPLAAKKIGLGMLINFIIILAISGFGLMIAYMILVL